MAKAAIVIFFAMGVALGAPATAQTGGDIQLAESFLATLQRAVAASDQRAVARMVKYPITVFVSGVRVPVQDTTSMIRLYDSIFTPELSAAIAKTPARPAALSADGLSIASGLILAQRAGSGFIITGITALPSSAAAAPTRTAAPRASNPTRIPTGRSPAKFSGLLMRRDDVQSYLITARKGQGLQVEISGFRGREALLHIVDAQSGQPVDPPVRDGIRIWKGTATVTGDYRIDVIRTAPDGGTGLLYVLAVTLR